jgi:hypothetical protein
MARLLFDNVGKEDGLAPFSNPEKISHVKFSGFPPARLCRNSKKRLICNRHAGPGSGPG